MLTVAYIGFGVSVREYHIPYVENRDDIRVKYVYRREEDIPAFAQYEPFYPEIRFTTCLDDVLGDPEVNLVVVNTPDRFHVPYAKQILNAGKHALVEKPFAPTAKEAREVFALAKEKGLVCMPNQNRRFDSDFLTAKQVLESGKLGHVFEVVTSYDYYRPHMMDGMPNDQVNNAPYGHGSHCLDQMISWFGTPDRVHTDLRQMQGAGMVCDYFDYDLYYDELGLKATAHANYRMAFQRPSFEIYGDKGAYIKYEKEQQERDLKKFYLPAGNDDFGLDAPEQWGTLRYYDEDGMHEERVPSVRSTYSQWYDALYETVAHGAPQLVKPEETLAQMRILEDGLKQLS